MAYSSYGILLFMPLLMAGTFRPAIAIEAHIVWNQTIYLSAAPPYGTTVTNRVESDEIEDATPKNHIDINFITFANSIINLNCSDIVLYKGDTVEIITDDSRWFYNSSFHLRANAIMMRFRTLSRKGKYSCHATADRENRKFLVDTTCACGRGEFNPEVWVDPAAEELDGMGHNRPLARPKRMTVVDTFNDVLRPIHHVISVLLHNSKPFCGATVISKKTAVTSAFCVKNRNLAERYQIIMGDYAHDLTKGYYYNVNSKRLKPLRIIKIISHPNYNGSYANNIAVVKFNSSIDELPVGLHGYAYPACLPINIHGSLNSRWFTSFGWATPNATKFNLGHVSRYSMISLESCRAAQNFTGDASEYEHSLCMIGPIIMCGIDAGGPIFYSYQNSPHVYLIGIIGEKGYCHPTKPQPKMHTNVTYYLDWLASVLKDEDESVCVY